MLLNVLLAIPVALILIKYLWYVYTKPYHHIPAPKGLVPFLGHFLIMKSDRSKLIKHIEELHKECGPTFVFWILIKPVVATTDVELLRAIMQSPKLINKGISYSMLHDWLGTGLLTSTGDKWRHRRKLITPAFHYDILSVHASLIEKHSKLFIANLKTIPEECSKGIEFFELTKHIALAVICETAMGIKMDGLNNINDSQESNYIELVHNLAEKVAQRYGKLWFWSPLIYSTFSKDGKMYYKNLRTINSFISDVIEKRIKYRDCSNQKQDSRVFLDILLDAYLEGNIDKPGILDEVNTFMFEGYDTVSAALAWTLYSIGRHKKVQQKVYEEVKSSEKRDLSCVEKLKQMKYVECVIKESLRIHPSVPLIMRQCDQRFEFGKFHIPKNTEVAVHILHLHRDNNIWCDAAKFQPERFLETSSPERNPFAYLPFSAGHRNCIGQKLALMELKLFIFYVINNFEIEAIQNETDLKEHIDTIHRTQNGLWLKLNQRDELGNDFEQLQN